MRRPAIQTAATPQYIMLRVCCDDDLVPTDSPRILFLIPVEEVVNFLLLFIISLLPSWLMQVQKFCVNVPVSIPLVSVLLAETDLNILS